MACSGVMVKAVNGASGRRRSPGRRGSVASSVGSSYVATLSWAVHLPSLVVRASLDRLHDAQAFPPCREHRPQPAWSACEPADYRRRRQPTGVRVSAARASRSGSRSPRTSVVRCPAVDSICWPAGAARLGPSDDVRLQQGLQARAAPRGRRLMDGGSPPDRCTNG